MQGKMNQYGEYEDIGWTKQINQWIMLLFNRNCVTRKQNLIGLRFVKLLIVNDWQPTFARIQFDGYIDRVHKKLSTDANYIEINYTHIVC